MIIDVHEKYDVSPEWFEEQALLDGWHEWLCHLLAVYKCVDVDGAREAARKMIEAGVDEGLVRGVMG